MSTGFVNVSNDFCNASDDTARIIASNIGTMVLSPNVVCNACGVTFVVLFQTIFAPSKKFNLRVNTISNCTQKERSPCSLAGDLRFECTCTVKSELVWVGPKRPKLTHPGAICENRQFLELNHVAMPDCGPRGRHEHGQMSTASRQVLHSVSKISSEHWDILHAEPGFGIASCPLQTTLGTQAISFQHKIPFLLDFMEQFFL